MSINPMKVGAYERSWLKLTEAFRKDRSNYPVIREWIGPTPSHPSEKCDTGLPLIAVFIAEHQCLCVSHYDRRKVGMFQQRMQSCWDATLWRALESIELNYGEL